VKKLFLHIGAGKTGSSALQNWLHENHENLKRKGIFYPLFDQKIKNPYQITSGNGVIFIKKYLLNASLDDFFTTNTFQNFNLLLSSELFQKIEEIDLLYLKNIALSYGYEIEIILFVRNLYDMAYSSYQQLIKKHLYIKSFEEYVNSIEKFQQFEVLKKYETVFENINVIHYNSCLGLGIDSALCEVLKISCLPKMKNKKVNRSLSIFESELLKQINKLIIDNKIPTHVSSDILHMLINKNPEKETELIFTEKLLHQFSKFQKDIEELNTKYLTQNKLSILDYNYPAKLVSKASGIPKEYFFLIEFLLIDYINIKSKGTNNRKLNTTVSLYSIGIKKVHRAIQNSIKLLRIIKFNKKVHT